MTAPGGDAIDATIEATAQLEESGRPSKRALHNSTMLFEARCHGVRFVEWCTARASKPQIS